MILNKLTIALIATFTIASHCMGTSDSPIESNTNASEAGAKSNKRKPVGAILAEGEEESSKLGNKAVRMSAAPTPLPSAVILPTLPKIPAWYYGSPMHAMTFEHLDYADLTVARYVSKEFNAMAKQVIMPTGRRWVSWFNNKFKSANNLQNGDKAFQDIVWASGRCPNALVKLREIVKSYYTDVPEMSRFWNRMNRGSNMQLVNMGLQPILSDALPIACKENLFTELKNNIERINKLEAEYAQACDAIKQTKQPTVANDLKNLQEKHNKVLAPIKAQQEKIVEILGGALRALAPYATASRILFELGERDQRNLLPCRMPIITNKENVNVSLLANKLCPEHRDAYIERLTLSCLPSVHVALVTQHDPVSRASTTLLENCLILGQRRIPPFNASLPVVDLIKADRLELSCANTKIELLKNIVNKTILVNTGISQDKVREALWALEAVRNNFLFTRIEEYRQNKELLLQPGIIQQLAWLIEWALSLCRTNELHECSRVAITGATAWGQIINQLPSAKQQKIRQHLALVAERAVILAADTLTAQDLSLAAYHYLCSAAFSKAAGYADQLFNEFNEHSMGDYLNACEAYAYWANRTTEPATAKQRLVRALEYAKQGQQFLLGISDLTRLQTQFQQFLDTSVRMKGILKPAAGSPMAEFVQAIEQLAPAVEENVNVLRAVADPQP